MATTVRLPQAVLNNIARQIADRMPQVGFLAPGAPAPAIGESLKVNLLTLYAVRQGEGPLAERLRQTHLWHHQIYQGQQAISFARSTADGAEDNAAHHVQEVVRSSLPQALQDTIAWIDENVEDDDAQASIVVAPDFFLTAVWLHGSARDDVVIASMANGLAGLAVNRLIPSYVFLEQLSRAEPMDGLGPLTEPGGALTP